MNRRNFVVGLGTVATISGVASVTSASFSGDSVNPSTNFQIVPEDAQLVVRRLEETIPGTYNDLADGNASWNDSEINDFGNVTSEERNPVVAHLNQSENGNLGAQLAFNNTNNSGSTQVYTDYTSSEYGFFEVANLGSTDEEVAIELTPFSDNIGTSDGDALTEDQVYQMFEFLDSDNSDAKISPNDSGSDPANSMTVGEGQVKNVGLRITITNDMYDSIQTAAGGAFSTTEPSIRLLEEITVGIDPTTEN
jgi:hypothetical protein